MEWASIPSRVWPLLLVLSSCESSGMQLEECEPTSFAPSSVGEFCEALERDVAISAERCWGGDPTNWLGYARRVRASCQGLAEGVRLGFLTYSATSAASCFRLYGCQGGAYCGNIFRATAIVSEGASCEVSPRDTSTWVFTREGNPCADGLYCAVISEALLCKVQAGLDEPCDGPLYSCREPWECLGPGPKTCKPVRVSQVGDPCEWPERPCMEGTACASGVCVPLLSRGSSCHPTNSVCEFGFECDFEAETCVDSRRCGEHPLIGAQCETGECSSIGYCGGDHVCHVRPVAGESCSPPVGGDEPVCLDGACRASLICE